jgi:hypothetical protein
MFTPSTISPAFGLTLCLAASAASADGPGLGKALTEADIAAWDISIEPDGTGLPPGAGTPRGPCLCGKMRRVSWSGGQGRGHGGHGGAIGAVGRQRADHRHLGGDQADRQFLALSDDAVRLHPALDAVAAAQDLDERRGLCVDRLYPRAEQAHRRQRHDEPADAAEGENAESRRIYRPLPRCNVSAGKPTTTDRSARCGRRFSCALDSRSSISKRQQQPAAEEWVVGVRLLDHWPCADALRIGANRRDWH